MAEKNLKEELQEIKKLLSVQTDKPLNFDEACKYLNISKSYLYKKTCRKEIPYFKPNGKLIYFSKVELDSWIFRNRYKTNAELEAEAESFVNREGA